VLNFITTSKPVIGICVCIGNGNSHIKSLRAAGIFSSEISPSFFEVGIGRFSVAGNAGIKLCYCPGILFYIGKVYTFYKKRIYQKAQRILFQDEIANFNGPWVLFRKQMGQLQSIGINACRL
jgi:hypothetical protein